MNPYNKKRKIDSVEYKDIRISELLNWTQKSSNKLVLPSLQRKFVWKHQQVCALFDSVMQGFPVGTFMFWKIQNSPSDKIVREGMKFYEFLSEYDKKELGSGKQIPDSDLKNKTIVASIDGQQRLTSFNIALRGKYRLNRSNRELYINLNFNSENEDEDMQQEKRYEFKFLNPDEVKRKYQRINTINRESEIWFKVKHVMNHKIRGYNNKVQIQKDCSKKSIEFVDFAKKHIKDRLKANENSEKIISQIERKWNRYSNILHTLHYKIHYDTTISYFELEQADISDIVEIFIRLNNAGTNLTRSEMLMSVVSAIWPDARSRVDNLLKRINEDGFEFDVDFVMRSALVLLDREVLLNTKYISKVAKQLEPYWPKIKTSILDAQKTLVALGYSDRNLKSYNSVIPIVYYFSKGADRTPNSDAREQIRFYLNSTSILGVFGTHGDQALRNIRESMRIETSPGSKKYRLRSNQKNFNYKDMIDVYKSKFDNDKKPIEVDKDIIENQLKAPYGPRTLSVLNALYPDIYSKYKSLPINQDHIYPVNGDSYILENGERGRIDDKMELFNKINSLPNLHLMWEQENKEKQNLEPCVYFSSLESSSRDYIEKNSSIPFKLADLNYDNFLDFYEKRTNMLRTKLHEIFHIY